MANINKNSGVCYIATYMDFNDRKKWLTDIDESVFFDNVDMIAKSIHGNLLSTQEIDTLIVTKISYKVEEQYGIDYKLVKI